MNAYVVHWVIDIEADTPEDAARKALAIHRNPNSIATVFTVTDATGKSEDFDLSPDWA